MADPSATVAASIAKRLEHMFPKLTERQIARIAPHGRVRRFPPGQILIEAGNPTPSFFVVTAGEVEIVRPSVGTESFITVLGPGQFNGEINIIAGRPTLVRTRARTASDVI